MREGVAEQRAHTSRQTVHFSEIGAIPPEWWRTATARLIGFASLLRASLDAFERLFQ
jgi:hypothetical protein